MSVLLRVLLLFLNMMSKFSGILEFSFDANSQRFVRSSFWQWYSWIWHIIFILPASCYGLYIVCIEVWPGVLINRSSSNISIDNWAMGWAMSCTIIGISSVLMLRKRRLWQKVLNTLVSIEEMHQELFGEEVSFYSTEFLGALMHTMLANWRFVPTNPWLSLYLVGSWYHSLVHIMLTKVTLLFNQHYLESLARCLKRRRQCSSAKRTLYYRYYRRLLGLGKNLQKFWWPVLISTLILESLYFIQLGLNEFVTNIISIFVVAMTYFFFDSNVLYMYKVTRHIHRLEENTLNDLYELEIVLSLEELQSERNLRLLRVSCQAVLLRL